MYYEDEGESSHGAATKDLRVVLNDKGDLRQKIEDHRRKAEEKERDRRLKWEKEHGPLSAKTAKDGTGTRRGNEGASRRKDHSPVHTSPTQRQSKTVIDPPYSEYNDIRAFSSSIRSVQWPSTFKLVNIDKYNPKENLEEWVRLNALGIQASGGDQDTMLAYVPIMLGNQVLRWL